MYIEAYTPTVTPNSHARESPLMTLSSSQARAPPASIVVWLPYLAFSIVQFSNFLRQLSRSRFQEC